MKLKLSIYSLIIITILVPLSLFFFTPIYVEIYTILLVVSIFFLLTIIRLKRIIFTKKLLTTIFLFLFLIIYFLINKNNNAIYDVYYKPDDYKVYFNIFYTLIILFCTFLIGYFYSLQIEHPLKIFSKIFSFQLIFFFFYNLWVHLPLDDISNNNLGTGFRVFLFLPFFMIAFNINKKKILIFLYIAALIYLVLISNRGALVATTIFFISYCIYPYLLKSRNLFRAYFFFNVFVIFILSYLYLENLDNKLLDTISQYLFNKQINTRGSLWIELIEIIKQNFLFGYGLNQASEHISYVGDFNRNNLASHNMFLEILLKGGLVGLLLFLFLLYSIFAQFFCYIENYWGRIGNSFVIGIIYFGATSTEFFFGNIVNNVMIWLFLAVAVAQVTKINKAYLEMFATKKFS